MGISVRNPVRRQTPTEAAMDEAKRRWEDIRSVVEDHAESWADVAGDQLEHAVDVAGPKLRQLRKQAVEKLDPVAERMKDELSDISSKAAREIAKLATDVRDASRVEADRVIEAIERQAEQAREDERRGRVKALIGFTAFGMVAGALIIRKLDQRDEPVGEVPAVVPEPTLEAEEDEPLTEGAATGDQVGVAPVR